MEYKLVICGGTFDRLHDAHRAFLRFAFTHGERVIIGITTDKYVHEHKPNQYILPFAKREQTVEDFLKKENLLGRAKIVAIDTKFDQTQLSENLSQALLVSEETYISGIEVNKEREKMHLAPLPLLVFPTVKNDRGEKISSTQIRMQFFKEITEEAKGVLVVPDALRETLRRPFGRLVKNDIPQEYLLDMTKVVVVGDATAKRFLAEGKMPQLAIVDFLIERRKTHETLEQMGFSGQENILHVVNPAGTLQPAVWEILSQAIASEKNTVVVVDGEEDLLVLPLILLLPSGFLLFYGQPKEGVVCLQITEQLKEKAVCLLQQFMHK